MLPRQLQTTTQHRLLIFLSYRQYHIYLHPEYPCRQVLLCQVIPFYRSSGRAILKDIPPSSSRQYYSSPPDHWSGCRGISLSHRTSISLSLSSDWRRTLIFPGSTLPRHLFVVL